MHRSLKLFSALALSAIACLLQPAAAQSQSTDAQTPDRTKHFDPLGRPPSTFTLELRNGFKAQLPFSDQRDFDEAKRGFIAEPPYKQIKADAGHIAWDMASSQWLLSGRDLPSIHPSLQRQAVLNMAYGL